MMQRLFVSCLLLLVSFSLQASGSTEQALHWLERMSASFRDLNYQGTFTYEQGDVMESLRIAHAVHGGEYFERLQYLDGAKREIIRRGEQLSCLQPGQRLVRFYQREQQLKDASLPTLVSRYYDLSVGEPGRIAGRKAIDLRLEPKDQHRLGYLLSLDQETGLLLRMKLIGPDQKVLERFQFVEVQVGEAIPAKFFEFDDSVDASKTATTISTKPLIGQWRLAWKPEGFVSTTGLDKVVSTDMATFSDGLAAFSVFVESGVESNQKADQLQRGATVVYSLAAKSEDQDYRITVVGEIPQGTAQRIAQSVQRLQ